MSIVRHELFAEATPDELKKKTNAFLSRPEGELVQFDYETDGYEKPYSASILYRQKKGITVKRSWRDRVFGLKKSNGQ